MMRTDADAYAPKIRSRRPSFSSIRSGIRDFSSGVVAYSNPHYSAAVE